MKNKFFKSYTLAEILMSLTLLGIIIALVLPTLQSNVNKRIWAAQKKALFARINNAIKLMPTLNGYGVYNGVWHSDAVQGTNYYGSVEVIEDTAALAFLNEGLGKEIKIKDVCYKDDNGNLDISKCGFTEQFTTAKGEKNDYPKTLQELNRYFNLNQNGYSNTWHNSFKHVNTSAVAFETESGEHILLYYEPLCISFPSKDEAAQGIKHHTRYGDGMLGAERVIVNGQQILGYDQLGKGIINNAHMAMCVNLIYDLNGKRGPNRLFQDVGFITAFYPTNSIVVSPEYSIKYPNQSSISYDGAPDFCDNLQKGYRIPTLEEAMSMNLNLYTNSDRVISGHWTGARLSNRMIDSQYVYALDQLGTVKPVKRNTNNPAMCVRYNPNNGECDNFVNYPLVIDCVKNDD